MGWNDFKKNRTPRTPRTPNKGDSTVPAWKLRYESLWFDDGGPTVRVLLHPQPDGEYSLRYMEAWVTNREAGKKRQVISNSMMGERPDVPDLLDYLADQYPNEGELDPFTKVVFSATILENFHVVTTTRRGKNRVFKDTKYYLCEHREFAGKVIHQCARCKDGHTDLVFGIRRHFSMFENLYEAFHAELMVYSDLCGNCGEGHAHLAGYVCPACKESIGPHASAMSLDEADYYASTQPDGFTCESCGTTHERLEPKLQCLVVKKTGLQVKHAPGCDNPQPFNPLSGLITMRFVREGNKSRYVVTDVVPRDEDNYASHGVSAEHLIPYNLFDLFGYMDLDEQAKNLGIQNPWAGDPDAIAAMNALKKSVGRDEEDTDSKPYGENQ